MCGIVGGVQVAAGHRRAALRAIDHRGPDGRGDEAVRCGGQEVWFGHSRLSILDLSEAGAQPMRSADSRWMLTFNGEIYNHHELRAALPGHPWRGHSDTETIVEAVAAWGVRATLARLNGMFALALLDRRQGALYLARDGFGIKPLYHSEVWPLRFASEIGALEAASDHGAEVDRDGLATLLALRFVPSPRTLLQGVCKLPAGHLLTCDLQGERWTIEAFVSAQRGRFEGSFDQAVESYGEHLRAAVHRQMLSDVPVGVLLSGGIDSAVIAALAREHSPGLPTFSVGFGEGHAECELDDAADTARILGLPNVAVRCGPEDLWTALLHVVGEVEEPLGTTSVLPMWHLVRRTQEHVSVVLTGQGSDEPLGGYRRYQSELARARLPFVGAARVARPFARLPGAPDALRRAARCLPESDPARRFAGAYELFSASEREALLGTADAPGVGLAFERWLGWLQDPSLSGAESMMRIDTRMQLADDLLLYGDKVSMAVALEARVPMLDVPLVGFIESLPLRYRVQLRQTKRVHRAFAHRLLPRSIIERPKKGFNVPFRSLCRGAWRGRVADTLLRGPHLEVLDRDAIQRVWREHLYLTDRTRQIFTMLSVALWFRQRSAQRRAVGSPAAAVGGRLMAVG